MDFLRIISYRKYSYVFLQSMKKYELVGSGG